jgi:hypothetical protein
MKLQDVNVGSIVYFKKSSTTFVNPEQPFVVVGIEYRKRRGNRVVLNGYRISSGELTDIPCSQMQCKTCKYHTLERGKK